MRGGRGAARGRRTSSYGSRAYRYDRTPVSQKIRVRSFTVSTYSAVEELEQLERFARWLLRHGEGTEPTEELDTITLPEELCLPEGCDLNALAEWVYFMFRHGSAE